MTLLCGQNDSLSLIITASAQESLTGSGILGRAKDKKEELESVAGRACRGACHLRRRQFRRCLPLRVAADTGVVMQAGAPRDSFASLPALARMAPGVFEGDFFDLAHAW